MRIPRTAVMLRCCCLLVALASTATQSFAQNAADLRDFYSANGLLQRDMYELASAEYRKFLGSHDKHEKAATARYGLSVCLFRLQRHEEASLELLRIAGDRDFEYAAEVATILGQCQLALGDFSNATDSFGEVLKHHVDHDLADDAAALQAETLYRDGKHAQVRQPCQMLITRWPESPHRDRVELFWGLAEMAQGQYAQAASRFQASTERFPDGRYADQVSLLL